MRLSNNAFYYGWIIVAVAFTVRTVSSGVRGAFGVFLLPLQQEFQIDRASISFAAALALLVMACCQPFVGRLVDKFGPRRLWTAGAFLIATSQFLLSTTRNPFELYVYMGVIGGLGVGVTASVPGSVLVTNWFVRRRGLALSLASTGLGTGLPLIALPTSLIILQSGWRIGYVFLGVLTLVILLPVTFLLAREHPPQEGNEEIKPLTGKKDAVSEDRATPIKTIFNTRPFWLLFSAYAVCGFTVSLMDVHLVPIAVGAGISQIVAAGALGTLGLFMSVGLVVAGFLADRVGNRRLLIMSYGVRGLALLGLLFPIDTFSLYVIVAIFGFVELATVPPTAILCRQFYGARSMGLTYGLVYLGHQLGSSISTYAGGWVYDKTGSYMPIIIAAALLGFFAATMSYIIDEKKRIVHKAPGIKAGASP
ncbi:MAG: MFS transporter [Thaumarchaeota archaeon]|nr:MFS transporter [Nitrososphaerota archaeon]